VSTQTRLYTRIAALEAEGTALSASFERFTKDQERRAKERNEALPAPPVDKGGAR
jgi:hypothetical protein